MKRLITSLLTTCTTFILALSLPLAAKAQPANYTVTPWTFVGNAGDCGSGSPAGTTTTGSGENVVSRWVNDMGNPAPSLYLQKAAPTTDCSSAGATINGVSGITLSELNFDYKTGEYCGAGAPRFNVVTSDSVTHFFGCSAGTATTLNNGWTHLVFDPANATQAFPVIAGGSTVSTIDIVFDEQGSTHLDNISVNGQIIGHGSTPWNKNVCKKGGYKNFTNNFGDTFKNQGQCVAFVNRNVHALNQNKSTVNVKDVTNQNSQKANTTTNTNTNNNANTTPRY